MHIGTLQASVTPTLGVICIWRTKNWNRNILIWIYITDLLGKLWEKVTYHGSDATTYPLSFRKYLLPIWVRQFRIISVVHGWKRVPNVYKRTQDRDGFLRIEIPVLSPIRFFQMFREGKLISNVKRFFRGSKNIVSTLKRSVESLIRHQLYKYCIYNVLTINFQ